MILEWLSLRLGFHLQDSSVRLCNLAPVLIQQRLGLLPLASPTSHFEENFILDLRSVIPSSHYPFDQVGLLFLFLIKEQI